MKTIIFNDDIYPKTVLPMLEFVNSNEGDIIIAIDSPGGCFNTSKLLTHVFNAQKERITLCSLAGVYSGAFDMFYAFEGKKMLTFGTLGMMHYASRSITMSADGGYNYKIEGQALGTGLKEIGEYQLGIAQKIMTKAELKKFKNNVDIYFSFARMKEIFPEAEII